jgi:cob(I)alamin adenosyltransferase
MKIYTKTGDKGETSLIGGTRVGKSHVRIESYGTVDELNSWVGLLASVRTDEPSLGRLVRIQNLLFTIGSHLASDPEKSKMKLPEILISDVEDLERWMDEMEEKLSPLSNFVLPGGNVHNAWAHISRCVCRRAERLVVELNETNPVSDIILQYLNRLSDFLFVFARYISLQEGAQEVPWITR